MAIHGIQYSAYSSSVYAVMLGMPIVNVSLLETPVFVAKGYKKSLVVVCCLGRTVILFVVVRLSFAINGMMVTVMSFTMLSVSLGSSCSVSQRVCTRVPILDLPTSVCPLPNLASVIALWISLL